jgi:hypothetical protein
MEEISKNIIFDSKILESKNQQFYINQLKITSLNLDDFNKRLNTNIILRYHDALNGFELETQYPKYGNLFVRHLSHYLAFYNNRNWLQPDFISYEYFILKSIHDHFYYSLKEKGKSYQSDIILNEELSIFLHRYDNYFPLGILDKAGENEYKYYSQDLVNSLKKLKLSIDQS